MKDKHTYSEKMARNGRTKDICKGTFICIQTLLGLLSKRQIYLGTFSEFCGILRIYELCQSRFLMSAIKHEIIEINPSILMTE